MQYKVALHRSEEGFAASVPGLPGCWSQGATEAEALENIRVAIVEICPRSTTSSVVRMFESLRSRLSFAQASRRQSPGCYPRA